MSRPLQRLVALVTTLAALLVLPTVQAVGAPPHTGVSHRTVDLPDGGVAVRLDTDEVVALTATVRAREVEVRWRGAEGWSDWVAFPRSGEHAPDAATVEATGVDADVSEPVWIGSADVAEVRSEAGGAVDLELVTMDGDLGYRADATPPASAEAFSVWPPIVPRSAWDPRGDCQPRGSADVAPSVERIFVHHTVVYPDYAPEEGDDVVRGVCLGHVNRRGFDDIGYNFLIDRYGVIYQGRQGGILNAVEGAHAQGFNWGSAGIAIVGDFQEGTVPPAAARALDQLTAWLADLHDIDPLGNSVAVSTGGANTSYAEGVEVDLPNVMGHRDTGLDTQCPGDHLYDIVRGSRPLAPRVMTRLQAEYGWPAPAADAPAPTAPAPPRPERPETPGTPATPPSPAEVVRTVSSVVDGLQPREVGRFVSRLVSARHAARAGR